MVTERVAPVDFTDWITLMGRTDRHCLDADVDFYPGQGSDAKAARQMCAGCPARLLCLEWAIHHELYGIWGGTSARQRCAIRRHRGINVRQPGAAWRDNL